MKKIISNLFFFVFVISCSPKVQVFQAKPSTPMKLENSSYVFENDTMKIIYSFWENHGKLSYTVFNKLNVPLYIDWKKSSFVKNTEKIDYYIDISSTKSVSKGNAYSYYGIVYGKSYNTSTTVKPEQVVFIAPKSSIVKDQFLLYTFKKHQFADNTKISEEDSKDQPRKKVKIKYLEYTLLDSPLSFRNFITVSTSDKFTTEAYVDNGFYIEKIMEMKRTNFLGKYIGFKHSNPYQNPSFFYIDPTLNY